MSKMLKILTITVLFGASIQAQAFDAMQCVFRNGSITNVADPLAVVEPTWFYVYEKEIDPEVEKTVLFIKDSDFASELNNRSDSLSITIRSGFGMKANAYNRSLKNIQEQTEYAETRQDLVKSDYKDKMSFDVRLFTHKLGNWNRVTCALCTKGASCKTEATWRSFAKGRKEKFIAFKSYTAAENNAE
jgi:hypothetical protein